MKTSVDLHQAVEATAPPLSSIHEIKDGAVSGHYGQGGVAHHVTTTNVDGSYWERGPAPELVRRGRVRAAAVRVVARRITGTGAGASFDLHQAADRKHSRDGYVKPFILRRELFYPTLVDRYAVRSHCCVWVDVS